MSHRLTVSAMQSENPNQLHGTVYTYTNLVDLDSSRGFLLLLSIVDRECTGLAQSAFSPKSSLAWRICLNSKQRLSPHHLVTYSLRSFL